jgi:hypothetical protein
MMVLTIAYVIVFRLRAKAAIVAEKAA